MDAQLPLARVGVESAGRRIGRYAEAAPTSARFGEGWIAVATGVRANDMNGVVSHPDAIISVELIDHLLAWFKQERLPASWLIDGSDPALSSALVARGARPETSGWWAGRLIGGDLLRLPCPADTVIRRVGADEDLEDWLEVAAQCGWCDDADDRGARRELYRSIGLDNDELAHWVAYRSGQPVGMASSFSAGGVVDLCNLAVVDRARRHGIGRALAAARIRAAHELGATTIVSALSPDGWQLYRTLGFVSAPVERDRWFYLPMVDD